MTPRLLPALATFTVLGLALAGCTQTIDHKSAENVIRSQIPKFGPVEATSVSCPSGVKKQSGVSFTCKATLRNTSTHQTANATITLHITSGGNRAEFSQADIHFK